MLEKKLIEEEDVECRPDKVRYQCLHEDVNLSVIKTYFTEDAWMVVDNVTVSLEKNAEWVCEVCQRKLSDYQSINCDGCLCWINLKCNGLANPPKRGKRWFCKSCRKPSARY